MFDDIQALIEDKLGGNEKKEMPDWFVSLMTRILKMMPCKKQRAFLVSSLFDVWEETILGLHEDVYGVPSKSCRLQLTITKIDGGLYILPECIASSKRK